MIMDINKLIATRRAVYPIQFKEGDIGEASIAQLLENATMAPTHRMTQPWFFKVYKNSPKDNLGKEMVKAFKKNNPGDTKTDFKEKKIIDKCGITNCIIGIFMKRSTKVSIPEWEEIAAVAMAVQNIWLSSVEHQIGCYWSSPQYMKHMHSFFNLNDDERCMGFMYLGKFDHSTLTVKERIKIEEKVDWLV